MNSFSGPFRVGERVEYVRTVTEADVVEFARISGDDNAIHLDEAFGKRTRFGGRVAHGALSFGFMAASQTRLIGAAIIWLGASVTFTAPVRIGDTVVMASDGMAGGKPEFKGFSLSVNAANEAEADKVFGALGKGGKVVMPLAKTFYSPRFGMVTDKFGVGWMVIVPQKM